jgi:AcrR family transcriptional regulator
VTTAAALTMHERVVAAAADLTLEVGWAGVTMGKLADRVGVSRQTVYNEVGSKPRLAEEMVLAELATFLAVVDAAFDRHPDDLVEAIRGAARGVLELAESNALLQAVVSASYGRVHRYRLDIDDRWLDAAIDMVVRLVLSHVVHPTGSPAHTADDIAWISERTLRP